MNSMLAAKLAMAATVVLAGCAAAPRPAEPGADPAAATAAEAREQGAVATDAVDPTAVRCIREATTGSRLTQRVCRTEAEWARIREEAQNYTRDMQGPMVAEPIP